MIYSDEFAEHQEGEDSLAVMAARRLPEQLGRECLIVLARAGVDFGESAVDIINARAPGLLEAIAHAP